MATGGLAYNVSTVSFGVESVNNPQTVTVNLYTAATFPAGTRTLIGTSGPISVSSANNLTVVTQPLFVTVPAGTALLVMELASPSGQIPLNIFYPGSNGLGQSARATSVRRHAGLRTRSPTRPSASRTCTSYLTSMAPVCQERRARRPQLQFRQHPHPHPHRPPLLHRPRAQELLLDTRSTGSNAASR